jgi:hypothetical protein
MGESGAAAPAEKGLVRCDLFLLEAEMRGPRSELE